MRAREALVFAAACAACGPAQQPAWTERDAQRHATRGGSAGFRGSAAAAIDYATLTPAAIDALDEAVALAAVATLGKRAPAARIALRAARLAHHRGDDTAARLALGFAGAADDAERVRSEIAALAAQLAAAAAAPPIDPSVVAVLLPLSGRFAAVGAELRAAIELAPAQGTRWLVLDTRGEPDGAAAAVDAAIAHGAVAILGPVGARESLAAARAAALRGIPIALLAPQDGADAAAGVFRLVDSPADEGRAVARLAAREGDHAVGVLAPRDDVGQEAADAFAAEARDRGLTVAAQGSYDPTGGDVDVDVKKFLNLVPATNPRLAEHLAKHPKRGLQTFTPDVPFSLLYIPDRADRAAIVAAYLPYYGVELRTEEFPDPDKLRRKHGGYTPQVVQLVGGAGWHVDSLAIRGGDAVQGAFVVDAFAGALGGDAPGQFAADYQQRTNHTATTAAAEAFDAATLVAAARAAAGTVAGPALREAMRAALAHARLDDGACGPAAIGADGELAREPSVLEVEGDALVVAPTAP